MRAFWTVVHRWLGLSTACFLVVAGLTGAVISWDHELDEWINADLMVTPGRGTLQSPLQLAAQIEAADPRVRITYIPLALEEGHAAAFLVQPREDATTGQPHALDYDTVFVDPVTGRVTGQRDGHSVALGWRNLMPWLRHLHESLHIPPFAGTDRWGFWLMGGVALLWLIDSFVGFGLTLPRRTRRRPRPGRVRAAHRGAPPGTAPEALPAASPGSDRRSTAPPTAPSAPALPPPRPFWSRWRGAWRIRRGAGAHRLQFDLHRAGGLWAWGIILVISFTSFSLNLYQEVFYPLMSRVSQTTPGPYETLPAAPHGSRITPTIGFAGAIDIARAEGQRLGIAHPPAGIWFGGDTRFYNVSFFDPEDEAGAMGMGLSNVYVDVHDGAVLGAYRPWHGTAADVFVQLQLPLHSGRILGVTGRVLMSVMGLVVAMLAVTGVLIWLRRRRARLHGRVAGPIMRTQARPDPGV